MKWIFLISFLTMSVCFAKGQKQTVLKVREIEKQVHFASGEIHKSFVKAPEMLNNLKSGTNKNAVIEVQYVNFPEEAKSAFEYAISIWEQLLSSKIPIRIVAEWNDLENVNLMASARPSSFFNSTDENTIPDVLYPVALIEKITGKELNNEEPDIYCSFNKNILWYFGTDGNTPITHYDFTTAVLHEIAHGLGFSGFLKNADGKGFLNNSQNLPSIYDYYLFNKNKQQISDNTIFPDFSTDLSKQITSNQVIFFRADNKFGEEKTSDLVYAPAQWQEGASIFHLDNTAKEGDRLMTAFARKGEAIHCPGETTMEILSEIGWEKVYFNFKKPADLEEFTPTIKMEIHLLSDVPLDSSTVNIIYTDNHSDSILTSTLNFDKNTNQFIANISLKSEITSLNYYFSICTKNNQVFTFPEIAPKKLFTQSIGPDNIPPVLKHNPVRLIAKSAQGINFSANASDNVGVNTVCFEYKIDGILQKPLLFNNDSADLFIANLPLTNLTEKSKLEYRIIAEDKSAKRNKKTMPAKGFYSVEIFNSQLAVTSYVNNFDSETNDFVSNNFSISREPGFFSGILQTSHPYPLSGVENEKYDLIAQLRSPIIIQENSIMSFDEIVLIEPGLPATNNTNAFFWDFVVVEGSKNKGETWLPFSPQYDSQIKDCWQLLFNNSLSNGYSRAVPEESMFAEHKIDLTKNQLFSAGDTVIIRFRLNSDNTINGWGWAIDNLKIQYLSTANDELSKRQDCKVYPNPFTENLFIEISEVSHSNAEVIISDVMGRIVHRENWVDAPYNVKKQLNLPGLKSGIYVLSIRENNTILATKKILKN